jgi:hypothetical protein
VKCTPSAQGRASRSLSCPTIDTPPLAFFHHVTNKLYRYRRIFISTTVRMSEEDPWAALSIHHVAAIFDAALGDPPAPPPGCAALLLSCVQKMKYDWYAAMVVDYRDLFEKCMRLLSAPRTPDALLRLPAELETCRCARGPQIVRDAPVELHTLQEDRTAQSLLNSLCDMLRWHLEERPRLDKLATRRTAGEAWPQTKSNLIPYSPVLDCLHRPGLWVYRTNPLDMVYQGSLQAAMIEVFGPALLPSLLTSPTTTDWFRFVITALHRAIQGKHAWYKEHPDSAITYLGEVALLARRISDTLFEEEVIEWLGTSRRSSIQGIVLLGNIAFASLDAAHRAVRPRKYADSLVAEVERDLNGLAELAAKILIAEPDIEPPELHPRIRDARRSLASIRHDAIDHLLHRGFGPQWSRRCYGPACLATYASCARRFRLCGGCFQAEYCSRRCQKKAWAHPEAPHREICPLFRRITVTQSDFHFFDLKTKGKAAVRRVVGSKEAEMALKNVEALRMLHHVTLRTWSFIAPLQYFY